MTGERSDEKNIPAAQEKARPEAWLHGPHGNEGRPQGSRPSPRQGPEAAGRLIPLLFPSGLRICRRKEVVRVLSEGKVFRGGLISVAALNTDADSVRFAFSIKRTVGNAVVRNRVRRRLREACRIMYPGFSPGWDVLVMAGPRSAGADYKALEAELRELMRRAGVQV